MKLPQVSDLKLGNKRVLLRCDFDVPLVKKENEVSVGDDTRLYLALETVRFLLKKAARVIIIAHLGRPGGKKVKGLSLRPVYETFSNLLGDQVKVNFYPEVVEGRVNEVARSLRSGEILILENLRFYPGESKNDHGFAQKLASLADLFINDAFAVSHREHASLVGVPRFLPSAFGLNFLKEVEVLERVYHQPKRPVVVVLGGRKRSKLVAGRTLLDWADTVLVGGELVETDGINKFADNQKVKADLAKRGEDITLKSAKEFARIIRKAGTVIWSGPMGAYESPRYLKGTELIARAVVTSKAFSVVGGGDTEAALTKLDLVDKVDHICSGGGAMLAFLARRGTLPGIEAIIKNK